MEIELIKAIETAESIAIFPHVSADGDAIGSSLALGIALKKAGKRVIVYLEESIPDSYRFLPGLELTGFYDEKDSIMELNIALDTGDMGRLASRADAFFKAAKTVNIDHHVTNTQFAGFNYVDATSASTGELVYLLLKKMNCEIDTDMAKCLYTAIATDTGGFKYGNTTAGTHRTAAELISTGIDVADLSQKLFDNTTFVKLKLTQKAIELLELYANNQLAVTAISQEVIKAAGAKEEDCDGLVNIGRSIEGVEVSVLLKEKTDNEIRINLRSKAFVDVSEIAAAFGGGGHKRAAGCTMKGSLADVKNQIISKITEKLKA
ncbi:MAG TPA: bifunctional oligoribonuclease/PAP phosphatase NrnA [Ruminiclostridium sp.]|nr:bifunctional oligoribonuclease/PAP phosphatase NrnA [Ruminiclostridium sp.]